MWLLVAITIINAWAHAEELVLVHRVQVAGVPLNIYDGLLAVGLLVVLFRRRNKPTYFRTDREHPALAWIIALFAAAVAGGVLGWVWNRTDPYFALRTLRNLVGLPVSVVLGYFLIANLKVSGRIVYLHVIAGVGVAILIIGYFVITGRAVATTIGGAAGVDPLRTVEYVSNYAGLAGTLLLYTIVSGVRLFRHPLGVILAALCFAGQGATLSRSDWVATLAGIGAVVLLLPRGQRMHAAIKGVAALVVLTVFLLVGVFTFDRVTGHDLSGALVQRVGTVLPGDAFGLGREKAWATRLPGMIRELQLWGKSPLTGQGFGIHDVQVGYSGLRHNTWTSTLAETGVIGFSAMALVIGSLIVVGGRMVRDAFDRASVWVGALGYVAGFHFLFHGLTTMSFNTLRWAIVLGVICGLVLRTRAIQLAMMRGEGRADH